MKCLDKIKSKVDKTVKYIFSLSDGLIAEVAYIDKDDGKDILCVSTQTACSMGCKFCHLTDTLGKLNVHNISAEDISKMVSKTYSDLGLNNHKLWTVPSRLLFKI